MSIIQVLAGIGQPVDPYFEYTTLLLPGSGTNGAQNNTFLDGSTNNFTITRNGNTTQGTFSPFSQTGWGNYFDGASDYLTLASNAAFSFGTGSFTYETWFYSTGTTSAANVFYDLSNANGAGSFSVFTTGGVLYIRIGGTGNDLTYTLTSSWINTWHHLAVVRNGTTLTVYLDGTSVATGTRAQDVTQSTPYIGDSINALAGYSFAGYLSNTRVVKGTAVYTTAFTPPTAPLTAISGTSLLTCQSNRFIDNSTNNFTITRNGDTRVVAFSPFNPVASWSAATYGGSGYFDGSGDYLSSSTGGSLGSGDFTIEFWVYATSWTTFGSCFESSAAQYQLGFNGTNQIGFYAGGYIVNSPTNTASLNQWLHVAICRSGSASNNISLWINGQNRVQGTSNTNYSNDGFRAGLSFDNFGIAGYLSNLRIVKGTAIYSGTTFTPPTAPLTAITNTSLLLNFTNAGIYDATSKNDLETVGNAQISNTTAKFGSTSMSFDGTTDYLVEPTSVYFGYGTGDFTIEFWVYFNSTSTATIFSNLSATASTNPHIYINSTIRFYDGGGDKITSSTSPSTGVWYHLAVCRASGSTRMFLNGTQTGSTYADTNNYGQSAPLGVGTYWNGGAPVTASTLNGYLQDVRVSKYARYTANFTPPTAAFPTL